MTLSGFNLLFLTLSSPANTRALSISYQNEKGELMKRFNKILVPTDLSEHSRRALTYGCRLAAEDNAALVVLHVANEFNAWELSSEFAIYTGNQSHVWPLDRVASEASLDLSHFLEPHLADLKQLASVTKRVILGNVSEAITSLAEEEKADLIILSPRRSRGLRHWLGGGITQQVTRLSPCPVLSITQPLPSRSWRGKLAPLVFGWPKQRSAEI
jgi:nucleotide-binding universal stress UspA family protein